MEPDAAPAGVRVRSSRLREAPGSRPSLLRGTALTGWTRRGRRRAKACRIGGPAGLRPRPEATAPGTEIAAWRAERRPRSREGARLDGRLVRRLARHTLACCGGRKRDDGVPSAAKIRALAHARGYLTIASRTTPISLCDQLPQRRLTCINAFNVRAPSTTVALSVLCGLCGLRPDVRVARWTMR